MCSTIQYREKAAQLLATTKLIDYSRMDDINQRILSILCSFIKPIEDEDLDENGELLDFSEAAQVQDRLWDGFTLKRLPEAFMLLLKDYEHYEILSRYKELYENS